MGLVDEIWSDRLGRDVEGQGIQFVDVGGLERGFFSPARASWLGEGFTAVDTREGPGNCFLNRSRVAPRQADFSRPPRNRFLVVNPRGFPQATARAEGRRALKEGFVVAFGPAICSAVLNA